ncbi:MAG TPA: MBL fold metallo-hydrolase [Pseudonocardiaceae bacterium]|jgi:glyoxylase-like metal-dependent hydrolase (beta-lactamase superfamily II)|nr:MBL fold metallo-hydrolase [Pseudonocardiaceae bacterium]
MITDAILRIPTSKGDTNNAFLVTGDDGLTLVDVGWAAAPKILLGALAEHGHSLADLKRIVITHAHPDHVRGLAEFRAHTRAEVLIHAADAPWLRAGRVPVGGRSGRIGAVLDAVPLMHWRPVEPDGELVDGEVVGGLRVIHTPGHSPGHVVLLHEDSGTLLVGDALFRRGGAPSQGPPALSQNPAERDASLAKLPLDVRAIGFAHGAPLLGADVDMYRNWIPTRG